MAAPPPVPTGNYLFAAACEKVPLDPTVAKIEAMEGKGYTAMIEFMGQRWTAPIRFREIPRPVPQDPILAFDAVFTNGEGTTSIAITGQADHNGRLRGSIVYHMGIGTVYDNPEPLAGVGSLSMNPHSLEK